MKKTLKRFVCDNCKKQITRPDNLGYPYELGWTYIYKMSGKILRNHAVGIEIDVAQYNIEDKHFCCLACQIDFIQISSKGL